MLAKGVLGGHWLLLFSNENKIELFIPEVCSYGSALVQVLPWFENGEQTLPEPMMTKFTDGFLLSTGWNHWTQWGWDKMSHHDIWNQWQLSCLLCVGVGVFSKMVTTFSHVGGSFHLFMATTRDVWIIPSFLTHRLASIVCVIKEAI